MNRTDDMTFDTGDRFLDEMMNSLARTMGQEGFEAYLRELGEAQPGEACPPFDQRFFAAPSVMALEGLPHVSDSGNSWSSEIPVGLTSTSTVQLYLFAHQPDVRGCDDWVWQDAGENALNIELERAA